MAVYVFGANPQEELTTGILAGFDREAVSGDAYESERVQKLYEELFVHPEDTEFLLGVLPDGKFALLGYTLAGHRYAVED